MKLIDTNVFIYALGKEHEYQVPCHEFLRSVRAGTVEANVDTEMFQEIMHYYHASGAFDYGAEALSSALTVFPRPFLITVPVIERAAEILFLYRHLQSRDAVHAAVVFEHGLEGIVSADRGFDRIGGLTRFDPRDD